MISLVANQKTIEGIFCSSNETYVIPMYQRPYSWGYDQLYELYRDLIGAYQAGESYFLGNIILARSGSFGSDGLSSVVDGQQRVITLWTLIKVLSLYLPEIVPLQNALFVTPWASNEKLPKIYSKIFEADDDKVIKEVMRYEKSDVEGLYLSVGGAEGINEAKCKSRVKCALLYFYQQFIVQQDKGFDLSGFALFLMRNVTILPIVQTAEIQDDAENKALTIFETINNRGMDLEDADIFKAKLYNSAYKEEQQQEFISMWKDFKAECDELRMTVDEVFRYYSQIIRGRERITSNEKKLREFFTNESFSPLKTHSYKEVLEELNKILGILKYVNIKKGSSDAVGIWLQIIGAYTNQYPMFAIVVYMFYHGVETEEEQKKFVTFLQSLVRYCFYMGSTTSVKFTIYNMIKVIANGGEVDAYYQDVSPDYFSYLGRLQYAYALLAFHLDSGEPIPVRYSVDKIVNQRDVEYFSNDWNETNPNEIFGSIGNLVVLDISKRYNYMSDKYEYYRTSQSGYVRNIFKSPLFTYENWKERDAHMKQILASFFSDPNKIKFEQK